MIRTILQAKPFIHAKQYKSLLTRNSYYTFNITDIPNVFNILQIPNVQTDHFNSNPQPTGRQFRDWTSKIGDKVPISRLSIPGTHDSGTYNSSSEQFDIKKFFGKGSYRCQRWSIETQLFCGIRFFDLRIWKQGNSLYTAHGPIKLRSFKEDAEKIGKFLNENKDEFVILAFKKENGDQGDSSGEILKQLKQSCINYYKLDNTIPSVGQLRGKAWIIRDNELNFRVDGSTSQPLKISGAGDFDGNKAQINEKNIQQKLFMQNSWQVTNISLKTQQVLKTAFQINHQIYPGKKILKVNFLSGAGKSIQLWPYQLADHQNGPNYTMNQKLSNFPNRFSVGVTVMDFPGQPLIQKIIESNSKYLKS